MYFATGVAVKLCREFAHFVLKLWTFKQRYGYRIYKPCYWRLSDNGYSTIANGLLYKVPTIKIFPRNTNPYFRCIFDRRALVIF